MLALFPNFTDFQDKKIGFNTAIIFEAVFIVKVIIEPAENNIAVYAELFTD
jgi:hypothetical protein